MPVLHRRTALIAALLGFFIVMLDTTIVNVALPSMGADLGAGVASLQWVVDAYALVLAAFQLGAGSVCDRLGARTVYLTGLAVFGALSAICALSPNSTALIVARAAQGLGAAAVIPGSLALLSELFDDDADRARAIGLWGGAGGIASAVGPVAGGGLVSLIGWRIVFWVNVPVIALAVRLTTTAVPAGRSGARSRGADVPGQILSAAALGCLTCGVIAWGEHGPSPLVVVVLVAGCAAGAVLVAVEYRRREPMLPPGLFASAGFCVPAFVGLCLNVSFFGQLFALSLFFQRYLGYSPWAAGLALTPQACSAIVAAPLGGRAAARLGPLPTMLAGLLVGAAGFAGLTLVGAGTPFVLIGLTSFAGGFGMALAMPAATSAAVASAPGTYRGLAGGVVNAARQVGSVVGVAALGAMVAGRMFPRGFLPGFRAATGAAAAVFLLAALVAVVVRPGRLRRMQSARQ